MSQVFLYCDGACSGNPGPGGWGTVLIAGGSVRLLSGFEPDATNNRMEIQALIKGLVALNRPCTVPVTTDSQYLANAFEKGWLRAWESNGWRTANKEPVKNKDLWLELARLSRMHALSFHWVRGHSGHKWNELCDKLAREAIQNRKGVDERSGLESF